MLDTSSERVTGRIVEVIPAKSCGFLRDDDSQTYFFHANYVRGKALPKIGASVDFTIMKASRPGENPRAIDVRVL